MSDIFGPAPTGWTPAPDPGAASFENQIVSALDMIKVRMARGERNIENVTFTNCRIEGPAVLLMLGGCHFEATDFGNPGGDIRTLVLKPASPQAVVGVIPVLNCRFTGCQFVGIGYTGPDSFLNQILALGTRQ